MNRPEEARKEKTGEEITERDRKKEREQSEREKVSFLSVIIDRLGSRNNSNGSGE